MRLLQGRSAPLSPVSYDREGVLPELFLVGVFAHQPALCRLPELGVDGKVLEVVFRELVGRHCEHDPGDGCPIAGGQAHRARLAAAIQHTVLEHMPAQRAAGRAQRHDLCVGTGISQFHDLIESLPEDLALADQDGPERPPAWIIAVTPRELHGHPQVLSIVIIKLSEHRSWLLSRTGTSAENPATRQGLRYPPYLRVTLGRGSSASPVTAHRSP